MQKASRRAIAKAVVRLGQQGKLNQKTLAREIVAYMMSTKRMGQLDMLLKDIAKEELARDHHLYADVSAAHVLSSNSQDEIASYLKKATGATTVELQVSVDNGLVGGFIIRTAEQELNRSVKTKLSQLATLSTTGE